MQRNLRFSALVADKEDMDVKWRLIPAALLGGLMLVFSPSAAFGHEDGELGEAALHKILGGQVRELPNGELKVQTTVGQPLLTHGPDTRGEMLEEAKLGANSAFLTGGAERNPI